MSPKPDHRRDDTGLPMADRLAACVRQWRQQRRVPEAGLIIPLQFDGAAQRAIQATGLDVIHRSHTLAPEMLARVESRRGPMSEDPMPLSPEDYGLLGQIISNPDHVRRGERDHRGLAVIAYEKTISGRSYRADFGRSTGNDLELVDLIKRSLTTGTAGSHAVPVPAPAPAPASAPPPGPTDSHGHGSASASTSTSAHKPGPGPGPGRYQELFAKLQNPVEVVSAADWGTLERRKQLLAVAFLILALIAAPIAFKIDPALSQAMRRLPEPMIDVFRLITRAGEAKWMLIPLGLATVMLMLAGVSKRASAFRDGSLTIGRRVGFVFASIAISGLLGDLLKLLGRSRPKLLEQQQIYGFFPPGFQADYQSFPSGHAIHAVALAVAVALVAPRWRWPLLIAGGAVAASRVIVNAHYLSDVLAGMALAVTVVAVLHHWCRQRHWL
ncbi:membrane hypothetical protein [uncultured Gammaproteobacteria bacterium]